MKTAVLVIFLCTGAWCAKKPLATDEKRFAELQQDHFEELRCLNRIDAIFESKLMKDLEKISIKDLEEISIEDADEVPEERLLPEPSKQMYNTIEQEWLMESGSTSKEIDSCMRSLVPEILPWISYEEINCFNSVFVRHIEKEIDHESIHKRSLEKDREEQLPFRKYISFIEFVELMFQSRNPDVLGFNERTVYQHAESFLSTENDKLEPTYMVQNGCTWKNAKALREAPNVDARFDEFLRQVQSSYDEHLGNKILENWNLTQSLSRDKYLSWLEANQKMMPEIHEEIAKLRTQNNDAQWLCDHAADLAYKFSFPQSNNLVHYAFGHYLKTSEILDKVKSIRNSLDELDDIRSSVLKTLVNKYENVTSCLSAFYHLVENHQRFDIASAFAIERYTYPEFYCKDQYLFLERIRTEFCKCVGSFCVRHGLATLERNDYELLQKPDGTYYVAITQLGKEKRLQEAKMDQELDGVQ